MNNKKMIKFIFRFWFVTVLLFYNLNSQAAASEDHHHGPHVHGIAQLNVALDNNELYIEFNSPAANIVGFEYIPENEKEKKAVEEAISFLKAGEKLFTLSSRADVRLKESVISTDLEDEADHNDQHEKKDADHHAHSEKHSEFKAVYRFHCNHPKDLKYMEVNIFEQFKGIEKIEVQVLTGSKQTAMNLTLKNNRITF